MSVSVAISSTLKFRILFNLKTPWRLPTRVTVVSFLKRLHNFRRKVTLEYSSKNFC